MYFEMWETKKDKVLQLVVLWKIYDIVLLSAVRGKRFSSKSTLGISETFLLLGSESFKMSLESCEI